MWTPTTREQYRRRTPRYQTDLIDEEWQVIEPLLPPVARTGRPRAWPMREIVNALFYVLRGGIARRLLPSDFPPWGTVYRWFATWWDNCLLERINHVLVMAERERVGREASPSAGIIDSQSVKTTEACGPRGYDAGKKVKGRKRHALIDTDGRALVLEPHAASIQDRDGGGPLLAASRLPFPFIERIVAGLEKRNRLLNPKERKIVAYHEMGHALVAMALPCVNEVHKVSIIPRGIGALGYTMQRPTEDRFLMIREELEDKIAVLLGGRAAERLVFGHLSTGAADDLANATDIARSMVARYGMDEELGYVSYDDRQSGFLGEKPVGQAERRYSKATAEKIDAAVRRVVDETFERTLAILQKNRDILDESAQALLTRETLDERALKTLTQNLIKLEPRRPSTGTKLAAKAPMELAGE